MGQARRPAQPVDVAAGGQSVPAMIPAQRLRRRSLPDEVRGRVPGSSTCDPVGGEAGRRGRTARRPVRRAAGSSRWRRPAAVLDEAAAAPRRLPGGGSSTATHAAPVRTPRAPSSACSTSAGEVVAAAQDHHVLGAAGEEELAVVEEAEVAGVEPAVAQHCARWPRAGRGSPASATGRGPRPGRRRRSAAAAAVGAPDLDLEARQRAADRDQLGPAGVRLGARAPSSASALAVEARGCANGAVAGRRRSPPGRPRTGRRPASAPRARSPSGRSARRTPAAPPARPARRR